MGFVNQGIIVCNYVQTVAKSYVLKTKVVV